MSFDIWPIAQLPESSLLWHVINAASGPKSRPNSVLGGGQWACEMTVPLKKVAIIKVAEALILGLDGGSTPIIVPRNVRDTAPWPNGQPLAGVPHSDGASFSDGGLYRSAAISARLAADASLRQTELLLDLQASAPLMTGECFSRDHPGKGRRLHQVIRAWPDGRVKVRPPWREASAAGATLNFDTPGCVMRLMNADEAESAVKPPYQRVLTLKFEEVFPDQDGNY